MSQSVFVADVVVGTDLRLCCMTVMIGALVPKFGKFNLGPKTKRGTFLLLDVRILYVKMAIQQSETFKNLVCRGL